MSMSNVGCSGYVVKAINFKDLLPTKYRKQFGRYIKDGNTEDVEMMLAEHLPDNITAPDSIFILNNEDESCDLESGVMYAYYEEVQLFELVPKQELTELQNSNINPEKATWVKFG